MDEALRIVIPNEVRNLAFIGRRLPRRSAHRNDSLIRIAQFRYK
jgi:hypothetical protein